MHAGLDLVHYVRNTLENHRTRLVMRTGQPGQAPEDRVIREYDIDDYKEKTELTIQKLRTLLYSKLRAYRDLCVIERQRDGLVRVLGATAMVQNAESLTLFASAVLDQLTALLNLDRSALYCIALPNAENGEKETKTIAATGDFIQYSTDKDFADLPEIVSERLTQVLDQKTAQHFDDAYVLYTAGKNGGENLLYLKHASALGKQDRQLLEIYSQSVAITFENIKLQENVLETQEDLVCALANALTVDNSMEPRGRVKRFAQSCAMLARLYGLPEAQVLSLKAASPLHSIAKAAPHALFQKTGELDARERPRAQPHAQFGLHVLQRSNRPLLKWGAEMVLSYHERWDGTGYPKGLAGVAIPVAGRIAALADAFDTLGADTLREERGKQFEPALVDLLFDNLDAFTALRQQYPNGSSEQPGQGIGANAGR